MAFSGLKSIFSPEKTFRPNKHITQDNPRYELYKYAEASLSAGINLREAVRKPPNSKADDWYAIHVLDFWNRINLIYGTISEECTPASCPKMSGGAKYEYHWKDSDQYKKPTQLDAPTYIGLLMDWIGAQIYNQDIFPEEDGVFPKNFKNIVSKIFGRMFRVFVHVYYHHFERLRDIGAEAHVNACYKHFYYFVTEMDLVSNEELEPLKDLTAKICK